MLDASLGKPDIQRPSDIREMPVWTRNKAKLQRRDLTEQMLTLAKSFHRVTQEGERS